MGAWQSFFGQGCISHREDAREGCQEWEEPETSTHSSCSQWEHCRWISGHPSHGATRQAHGRDGSRFDQCHGAGSCNLLSFSVHWNPLKLSLGSNDLPYGFQDIKCAITQTSKTGFSIHSVSLSNIDHWPCSCWPCSSLQAGNLQLVLCWCGLTWRSSAGLEHLIWTTLSASLTRPCRRCQPKAWRSSLHHTWYPKRFQEGKEEKSGPSVPDNNFFFLNWLLVLV